MTLGVSALFQLEKSSFRQDINGLRAWAVVAVMLFHFGIPGFSGGFAGVDVFFVISGFLMTDIIVSGLVEERFRLGQFYLARAKRIFPALIALVLVWMLAGWFFLPTPDYQELGSQIGYALGFISNIEFANEAGYFDSVAHEKWMLHTWSLSVEWQFYLIFPIFLWCVAKLFNQNLTAIFMALGVLFVGSLGYAFAVTQTSPSDAFYLLPSRAWEMAAGGIVFFLARLRKPINISSGTYALAWAMMFGSFFMLDAQTIWPAPFALFAVGATMLLILASRQNDVITAHPVAQWLGQRSYSIYLWHWPFVVLLFFMGKQDSWLWIVTALAASLMCAECSYRWVENPARKWIGYLSAGKGGIVVIGIIVIVYAPAAVIKENHFGGRVAPEIDAIAAEIDNRNPRREECQASRSDEVPVGCTYGGDKLGVIVIGDSHAGSVIRSVERSLPSRHLHVLDWTMSGCPVIQGIDEVGNLTFSCDKFIERALTEHQNLPPHVPMLVVSRFAQSIVGPMESENPLKKPPQYYIDQVYEYKNDAYFEAMTSALVDTVCQFAELRPVWLLRPIPELPTSVPQTMSRSMLFDDSVQRVSVTQYAYEERQSVILAAQNRAAEQCGIEIIELPKEYCDGERCWGDYQGRPMYYDDDHLSEFGASFLEPKLRDLFESLLVEEETNAG